MRSSCTCGEITRPGRKSLDEPLNIDWDGNELLLSDVLVRKTMSSTNIEDEVDKNCFTWRCKLSGRERKIMELRFGLNNGMEKLKRRLDLLGISNLYFKAGEKNN